MKFTVENEKQLVEKVYKELGSKMQAGFYVGLVGDLGAGKTTLVAGILKKLGLKIPVTSPTFTLRKIYDLPDSTKVQHIDLYRHQKGFKSFEIEEWLEERQYLTFVEWPENLSKFSAYFDVICEIRLLTAYTREVELKWN